MKWGIPYLQAYYENGFKINGNIFFLNERQIKVLLWVEKNFSFCNLHKSTNIEQKYLAILQDFLLLLTISDYS